MRKLFCGLLSQPSVVILFILCNPSCVEVIVEEFEFVGIPLSVEVIIVFGFVPIPLLRG